MEQELNYDQPIEFVIGFAGSGKSTYLATMYHNHTKEVMRDITVDGVTSQVVELQNDMIVLTPTHKAADVLRAKGIVNVFTIHSVLKLVPTINKNFRKGDKLQRLKTIGDVSLAHIKDIAIDEYSMINSSILDRLLAVLPTHCNVTVFGDSSQLPPVDGSPIEAEWYTDNITKLTVQHRADNLDIVNTFMRFHDYIETQRPIDLKVYTDENGVLTSKEKHKGGLGTLDNFNADTDTILAFTNDMVIELNDTIAERDGDKELQYGDDIIVNQIGAKVGREVLLNLSIFPTCISKGKLKEGDDLEAATLATLRDIARYGTYIPYPTMDIDIDGESYEIHYDLHHYRTSKELRSKVEEAQYNLIDIHNLSSEIDLVKWCKKNPTAKGVRERAKAWSEFLTHQNLVFDVRRPYCTTVHKAQGKEFKTVYISQDDIKKSIKQNYYTQYARLMYVALSRAIDKVVII